MRTWGSAPLHPRLYAIAALRGLNTLLFDSVEIVEQAVSQALVTAGVDRNTATVGIIDFITAPKWIKLAQQVNPIR